MMKILLLIGFVMLWDLIGMLLALIAAKIQKTRLSLDELIFGGVIGPFYLVVFLTTCCDNLEKKTVADFRTEESKARDKFWGDV